jgi:ribosomal protein S18 acetylase RimI-like enzyme
VVALRNATGDDLAAVVELWRREAGPTRHAGKLEEATALVRRDPEALVIAEHDGIVVGTIIAGWDGWRFHIYRLAVATAHRRQGVATALLASAIQRARALGAVRVDAMVNAENVEAERFWHDAGFDSDVTDRRWSLPL